MDKNLRNNLRSVVTQCRRLLEDALSDLLQGAYGIHPSGKVEDVQYLPNLSEEDLVYRERVIAHLRHIESGGLAPRDAVAQLVREAAFTHLNRLCALKLMARRGLIYDPVGRVLKSRGFLFYLADHPDDERLYNGGEQERAYRHFLAWLSRKFSDQLGALFSPHDLADGLFPPHRTLEAVLALLNGEDLQTIWDEDETIGWVYQYFNSQSDRDKARYDENNKRKPPQDSYELAVRNQFFTPRYIVEFLIDNTLGRIWYEMRKGETHLADRCRYLVRRPEEIFLAPDQTSPDSIDETGPASEKGQISTPAYVPHREPKDPREIKVIDPACGSGHFLLYCFDLFVQIYAEAYAATDIGAKLRADYPDAEAFRRAVPCLILEHNLHGIDIDLRATQIAGLALWLRAQRAYQEMGIQSGDRPQITHVNIVCAEPMPGERELLREFVQDLQPRLLGQLVEAIFERMKLAGEAGSLLRIEEEIRRHIDEARRAWEEQSLIEQMKLFDYSKPRAVQQSLFDVRSVTNAGFWGDAEAKIVAALRAYAERASDERNYQRRLFAADAMQGFAFIDICRQSFDVVLMNPPFGEPSKPSKDYVVKAYPRTKNDVYTAFIERWLGKLAAGGMLGAITSRTGFFQSSYRKWREEILLGEAVPTIIADLGSGVLDTAMVETAAYCLAKQQISRR